MPYNLFEIAGHFSIPDEIKEIKPFGNGHINDTFRIFTTSPLSAGYILQRKNHHIFKDIQGMMENIVRVAQHIRNKLKAAGENDIDRKVITHIKTHTGEYFHMDENGNYWTVFLFITDSVSVEKIENPEHAFLAGKGFGIFQNQLSDLPGKPLNETIIDFHNIEFRYRNFRKALAVNFENRTLTAKSEIDFALQMENEMHTLIRAQKKGLLPTRITHNDTKINNILFDKNGQILCVIDLDTVMPGLVHFDFGDAIRTAACTTEEDETDLSKISINLEIFEAFSRGFIQETKKFLTKNEIDLLTHAAKFMTFIMGLRFLTDFLEGDVYYKIKHPSHNIERCRAQFKLVSEITANESQMNQIIHSLSSLK